MNFMLSTIKVKITYREGKGGCFDIPTSIKLKRLLDFAPSGGTSEDRTELLDNDSRNGTHVVMFLFLPPVFFVLVCYILFLGNPPAGQETD